jgi:hypothetical protein
VYGSAGGDVYIESIQRCSEEPMTSDDVTAWAAISFGAALSVGATALLLQSSPSSPGASANPPASLRVEVVHMAQPPAPIVDFAIIRSQAESKVMVGPEGPSTGWVPTERLEIRRAP